MNINEELEKKSFRLNSKTEQQILQMYNEDIIKLNEATKIVGQLEPLVIKTEVDTVNTVSANQRAKRWAMMNFDKWNEVTGFVDPHISYYDEITALIEDAVEFGYGVALKQPLKEIMKVIKKSEGSL